jgi:AraC-like DNA-binding protein
MKDIHYEFVDLDSNESFAQLGKTLGGVLNSETLYFDNHIVKGQLTRASPDPGVWIRKWKLTTFRKIILHKLPAAADNEKKFTLIYFLDPDIFSVQTPIKKLNINGPRNNLFLTSDVMMDFSVIPKREFYVVDIAFTMSWLLDQFDDADPSFKNILNQFINSGKQGSLIKPCNVEEFRILHELEVSMQGNDEDVFFLRSKVYNLILNFFSKTFYPNCSEVIQKTVRYDQLMEVEMMIIQNVEKLPRLDAISKKVNMSVPSLLRQFKIVYGKSIYKYYIEKKMELAKKIIIENRIAIKDVAEMVGYKQASPFIESFTKYHGYSPGSLKVIT